MLAMSAEYPCRSRSISCRCSSCFSAFAVVCLILFCISYLTLTMWSCHNNFFSIFCCVWYRSVFHLAVGFTASRGRLLVYMICMRMIWVITGAQLDIKYFKWTFRSIFHINILAPGRLLVGHSLYMHRAFQPGALGNWPPSKGASGTSPKALNLI